MPQACADEGCPLERLVVRQIGLNRFLAFPSLSVAVILLVAARINTAYDRHKMFIGTRDFSPQ